MKAELQNKSYFFYLVIACVAMFPLTCGYIMDGGIIREWMLRVDEIPVLLKEGGSWLFPSDGTVLSSGGQLRAMDSNMWFLLPALVTAWTGKPVVGWECYMIFMQIGTLFTALMMFRRIFGNMDARGPVFFGVLLYMTCPYRIYVCYDLADMAQVAVWTLLPLYIWSVLGVFEQQGQKLVLSLVVATLSLVGIAYANLLSMLVVVGFTLIVALWSRKLFLLVPMAAGCTLTLPCLLRLYHYLFRGGYVELEIPVTSIMGQGYDIGEFFNIFVYREGHPGMGPGMLLCLLTGLWLLFVKGAWNGKATDQEDDKIAAQKNGRGVSMHGLCVCFTVLAVLLLFMSLQYFPWEYVQRLGQWALKLVALFGTPGIFFGLAQIALCVLGARSMGELEKHEEKSIYVSMAVIVTTACLGICIYQCNMLTYTRVPL